MKLAVVLFNLGGPETLEAVEPFLRNLFSDPAIIGLPGFLRMPLARWIAKRRTPIARAIYEKMGGGSPILPQTLAQARALEDALAAPDRTVRVFVAMRASPPDSREAARAVADWGPDRIVLLPLYPQFSTTTTASSVDAWRTAWRQEGGHAAVSRVCCYPWDDGFIRAATQCVQTALGARKPGLSYRMLFSAHGLPERIVARGDPYPWQVTRTVGAIAAELAEHAPEWRICYQSRVGPLKWIQPATDAEIRRAGAEGKALIVVPVAFVSEHSETLVELDLEYAALAQESGVPDYIRVPTVGTHADFIGGLAQLVLRAAGSDAPVTCAEWRICPAEARRCGFGLRAT